MGIDLQFVAGAASVGTAWLWKEFGKDIIKIGVGAVWRKFKFTEAKTKYQNRLKEQYSTMSVLYKLESVPLDEYYVDLFVLEEPEAFRRYGVDYLESYFDESVGFSHRGKRSAALLIVEEYDRVFVLGKPGAGKTTYLKYLASLAAEEKIKKVPIFISFNLWAYSKKSLFDFIVEQFEICGFPEAEKFIKLLLERGDALILFDGLDEVSEVGGQRGSMIYELENLLKQYSENKFVITCRNAANDYKFDRFVYVEIADLTDTQISVFVNKWFSKMPSRGSGLRDELLKEENRNLKELLHNPLLLGMLCLVFEETSRFPSKRGMVYKEAVDALMKRWDKERGIQRGNIQGFTPAFEKKLLSHLAYRYSVENKVYFEKSNIEKKIEDISSIISPVNVEGNELLTAIEVQHGLLAQRARHVYTFSHLTFQEYFTAQYIIDQLSIEENLIDDLFTRLHNQRWREVFPLVASLLTSTDVFFENFLNRVREPIKKDKILARFIKDIDGLAETLKDGEDFITARMRALALSASAIRLLCILQKIANQRASQMGRKVLSLLGVDDSVVSLSDAKEVAEIISLRLINKGRNKEKVNKVIVTAAKYVNQIDFETTPLGNSQNVNFENIYIQLRNELRVTDEVLGQDAKKNIQYALEKKLILDTAFRIALTFKPKLISDFIEKMNELEFPKTFANNEEWQGFREKLLQVIAPKFDGRILDLKEDHASMIEQFIKNNIFLLDCLQQSESTFFFNSVFSMSPLSLQG